jgi:biotin carboxyl carrier protein
VSDADPLLGLVDDLAALALPPGIDAVRIEVEADGFAVSITRQRERASESNVGPAEAATDVEKLQKVHATTVGIFSAARDWATGQEVSRGDVLGGIQSLGKVADIKAPADGEIREVLVTAGAPVEYGQALFVIAVR